MKIQTVTYKDDLGGAGEATTVVFEYEGRKYEIDLNTRNEKTFARRIAAAYAPFIAAARDVTTVSNGAVSNGAEAVRDWARDKGYPVNDRGRVPGYIYDAYAAAHR